MDGAAAAAEGGVFTSYAQNAEDVVLWRALRDVTRGRYVDVGASEPEADSVTHAFYLRGWRGVNVEPAAEAFARLAQARPDDVNLRAAVGREAGEVTFFSVQDGNGLSTIVDDIARQHEADGWPVQAGRVPMLTLCEIFDRHAAEGDTHFLKIDVEGAERAVLEGADFTRHRPWIVLLEATLPNSPVTCHEQWEDLLDAAGYRFVYFDGLNRFYLAGERWQALHAAFASPANVFDRWQPAGLVTARAATAQATRQAADAMQRLEASEVRVDEAQARLDAAQARLDEAHARLHAAISRADQLAGEHASERQRAAELERVVADNGQAHERIARMMAERDAYAQELFESNRHCGVLMAARQSLLDQNGEQQKRIGQAEEEARTAEARLRETLRAAGEEARLWAQRCAEHQRGAADSEAKADSETKAWRREREVMSAAHAQQQQDALTALRASEARWRAGEQAADALRAELALRGARLAVLERSRLRRLTAPLRGLRVLLGRA